MAIIAVPAVRLPLSPTVCLDVDRSAGSWAFGSPQDAHFYFSADVEVNDRPPMPANLSSGRSPWQVGFIQNVISDTRTLRYDNMSPISNSVSTPCLDALPEGAPWIYGSASNVLHYGQVLGVNSFLYQSGGRPVRFRISMADWPRFVVYNFFGGGSYPRNAGSQVRSIENITHFRTWIAAREQMSPPNVASSYILFAMINFAIKVTITLSPNGANPLFVDEYRAALAGTGTPLPAFATLAVAADYGRLVNNRFAAGRIRWGATPPGMVPVVIPPLANDLYPSQMHSQNSSVAPQSLSLMTTTRCL